jgi:acetyl esterase/lipase
MNWFTRCTQAIAILLALTFSTLFAQSTQPAAAEIPLWPGGAPGARGNAPTDIPTITPYLSSTPDATAVIVLPGGGYSNLSMVNEGSNFAQFLNKHGVTAFVLKYRLGSSGYRHPIELGDVSRAIRMVRARAADWKIDPKRVGVIGSSAGGHLASAVMTHFDAGDPNAADPIDKESCRPDFGVLCYPVITMGDKTHGGSKNMLIGRDASPELIAETSSELHVTPETPPCFIWAGLNDTTVPVENTLDFAAALKKAGVPFDLHIYQNSPHGQGMGRAPLTNPLPWTGDLLLWMNTNKLLPPGNTDPFIAAPRGRGPGTRGAAAPGGAR